ncbi:MAG: hypothetical protein LUF30_05850, partial [Lachnospiraceae bacterium]|nr:hypothetical protein [Lachnospiraceae bacterium]
NQILTFNNMTDQLIDLVDFEYDWYPGEDDPKTDWSTGEATGGYDFWDGTAAAYITQNLDFETYPYYGFDVTAIPNTTQDTFVTTEGVEYERNIYYNDEGWPMLEHIVRGDMGHFHYTRDAQIIWNDLFSHYSRDPETGVLYYDGVAAGSSEVTEVSTDVEEAVAAEAETEIDFATLVNDAKQLLREDAETAVAELTQLYVMGIGEAAEKLGDAYKT